MRIKKILKFGGSSVASPERIREVASIVLSAARKERVVVIVSAFQGVTNQLLECARLAEVGDTKFQSMYKALVQRHTAALKVLHNNRPPKYVAANLETMLIELYDVLQGIYLLRHSSPRALDLAASFGERLSALIIASFLQQSQPSCFVDSRETVKTDDQFTRAIVQFDKTNRAIKVYLIKPIMQSRHFLKNSLSIPATGLFQLLPDSSVQPMTALPQPLEEMDQIILQQFLVLRWM